MRRNARWLLRPTRASLLTAEGDEPIAAGEALMQELLDEARTDLGLNEGEYNMLILDQPDVPHTTTPVVMLAQNGASQASGTANRPHVLGVCTMAHMRWSGQADLYPIFRANNYFGELTPRIDWKTAQVIILKQPQHGQLKQPADVLNMQYEPDEGYLGKDYVVLQVEGNGYKVQIRYYISVTDDMGETKNTDPVCKETNGGHWWKISLNPAPDYTSDIQPLLTFTGISGSVAVARVGRNNQRALRRTKNLPILASCLIIDAPGTRAAQNPPSAI